jgi:hypothetical protein
MRRAKFGEKRVCWQKIVGRIRVEFTGAILWTRGKIKNARKIFIQTGRSILHHLQKISFSEGLMFTRHLINNQLNHKKKHFSNFTFKYQV